MLDVKLDHGRMIPVDRGFLFPKEVQQSGISVDGDEVFAISAETAIQTLIPVCTSLHVDPI